MDDDLLWFIIYCSSVVLRYVPPMYLFAPSIKRDLLTNLGFESTVLLTLGRRVGSSKSAFYYCLLPFGAKSSRTRFCCYLTWVYVIDLRILVVCWTVVILFTELDLRIFAVWEYVELWIFAGASINGGIRGVLSFSSFAEFLYFSKIRPCSSYRLFCFFNSFNLTVFSTVSWFPLSLFKCLTMCILANVFPKAWPLFYF